MRPLLFMTERRRRLGGLQFHTMLLLVISIVIGGFVVWSYRQYKIRSTAGRVLEGDAVLDIHTLQTASFPVPPLPKSPFLNTAEDVEYVGSQQCRECHEDAHDTYRETGMGRSLDVLDPEQEPPDTVVDHLKSGRRYEVYRQDGQMRHRELRLPQNGQPATVMADYPIQYVIGSGRHSRSYLLKVDGFLVESPLTWYTAEQRWDMSPGYDEENLGFSRAVDEGCLSCHSGDSRSIGRSFHRMQIHETWIGCERCHGPGKLHVDRWRGTADAVAVTRLAASRRAADNTAATKTVAKEPAAKEALSEKQRGIDRTIVNPAHLDRQLSESICSQCHLRATSGVHVRGRSMRDYRPGLPLDLFRADYRLAKPESQMTVVGHVEQLRLSNCYQQSQLTCVTCHDPHGLPKKSDSVAFYRQKCLECHGEQQCSEEPAAREATSIQDNCLQCHMPTSDTEIPHLAFTHHRIGIHPARSGAAGSSSSPGELTALSDLSAFSELEQQRMLGLAIMQASEHEEDPSRARMHEMRAYRLLRDVWHAGLRDTESAAALALLAGRAGDAAGDYVIYALDDPDATGMVRINALLAAAAWHAERGELTKAVDKMHEVVQLRRDSGDWKLLGFLARHSGNHTEAQAALMYAAEIDGQRPVNRGRQ